MKSFFVFIILSLGLSSFASAEKYHGDSGFITSQLVDWCVGDTRHQNFCHAYLLGVYESSTCLLTRKTPDWIELKKTFVSWVYVKKDDAYVSASASAAMAFYETYGCKSSMQDYLSNLKKH